MVLIEPLPKLTSSLQITSQVDNDLLPRLRTADQQSARARRVERVGSITHRAGNQPALAIVADARPARPPYRDVAGLRQLEQTLVFFIPSDGEATTKCERNPWPLRPQVPLARGQGAQT